MRFLPVAMIGLALLAGCSGQMPGTTPASQYDAPYAGPPPAMSGSSSTSSTGQDSIDRFAAAYEAQHPMRRY